MKNCHEIKQAISSAKELKGVQKLGVFKQIRDDIHAIERQAVKDWTSVSLEDIRKLPELISEVEGAINRLEAGLKRRSVTVAPADGWGR